MPVVEGPSSGNALHLDHIEFEGVNPQLLRHRVRSVPRLRGTASMAPRPNPRPIEPEPDLDPCLAWVLRQGNLAPEAYRAKPLLRRVPALLRLLRVDSLGRAQEVLQKSPELVPAALSTLLIGVSSFFRDQQVFDQIHHSIIPDLLKTRSGLRVLSAGVSSGHELYSVAMVLAQAGVLAGSSLVGMDCRQDALTVAQEGVFLREELADVPAAWNRQYFTALDEVHVQVCAELRQAIRWECTDLLTCSFPVSDLVLFRNVSIYLADLPAACVWEGVTAALTPGGVLIAGRADRPPRRLPLRSVSTSIYMKEDALP